MFGTFTAILAIVAPIATLSYPAAIILPSHDREAFRIIRLTGYISCIAALLISLALILSEEKIAAIFDPNISKIIVLALPITIIAFSCNQSIKQWIIRKELFGVLATVTLAHSAFVNGAKAICGLIYPAGVTLVLLTVIGYAIQASLFAIAGYRRATKTNVARIHAREPTISEVARRYIDFPLYRAPQNLINAISQSLPIILLAGFFGPVAAGFYTLSATVMGAPSSLLGASVRDVFYPRVTKAARQHEDIALMIIRTTAGLVVLSILPFVLVFFRGPELFNFIFGEQWIKSGEYARWLSLLFLFNLINKPSVAAVPVLRIQRGLLVYEILSTLSKLLAFLAGVYIFESDLVAVAAFSIVGVLAYSLLMLWVINAALRANRHEGVGSW